MKRFYVDGHEYDVVAIKTVFEEDRDAGGWNNPKEEYWEFKYITIRTQIPKVPDVIIEQHSTRKQEYIPCSTGEDMYISVMPPFNYEHTGKRDIQEGWSDASIFGDVSDGDYKGETIKNKPPVLIHIEAEEREPQFKGELKEKYNKRPHISLTLSDPVPAPGLTITGYIDGRGVSGGTFVDYLGNVRWWLDDELPTTPDDLIYNQNGQDVSNMTGVFVEYDYDGDGDLEWIMTIDWLSIFYGVHTPWDKFTLNEDYLCFFAVDEPAFEGIYLWDETVDDYEDWEAWMTEQWHTLPDLYTEISIQQDDDQLYMLTNDWWSDETVLRVPYYEDGAISNGTWYNFTFFVPTFTWFDSLEATLYHEFDDNIIAFILTDPIGTVIPVAGSPFQAFTSKQSISIPGPLAPGYPAFIPPGLWQVSIFGTFIEPGQDPESFWVDIEVRSTAVERVKFWYDPGECDDIYVNTAIITDGAGGEDMCRKGDANQNCQIDFGDLDGFAQAFGTSSGEAGYNVAFDFDDSGSVGFGDLDAFAQIFGQSYDDCTSCDAPPWQQWP
jgi:hypothetical protein